jgi:D-alanine-D-alanine ligase
LDIGLKKPNNIAVLMGGQGEERDISIKSGKAIQSALETIGYNVLAITLENTLGDIISDLHSVDLVFLGLHGSIGENGTIQGFLESLGVKYTGSDPLSSAICMDKNISKIIARHSKVNTPNWEIVTRGQPFNGNNSEFPLVIKPNDQGSTVGLTIVHDKSELGPALNLAFNYSSSVMVEQFIEGREFTVTLIEGKALPVCEIIPSHELYDYECKYTSGMSKYLCPAVIDLDLTKRVQEITERLFDVLECRHYSRADFRLDHDDNLWFLEMNTLPGMTDTSLVPMAAKAAGLSFNDLIDHIVLQACSE